MKPWYEELFENSALVYDKQPYVHGTKGEVDFIEHEIAYDKSAKILDIGCGTGRHAIELAKRGYSVTGIDLSASQLARARTKAEAANVHVEFKEANARSLTYNAQFDAVLILCGGAFPLMETDEMNFDILKNASNALKNNGVLVFTTLNGLYAMSQYAKAASERDQTVSKGTFDVMTFREHTVYKHVDDNGERHLLRCNLRYHIPPEMTWLLHSVGFSTVNIYGAELGKWNRDKKLSADDLEMLIVARKLRS